MFVADLENRERSLGNLEPLKTSRESESNDKANKSMNFYGEIQQAVYAIKQTLLNSVGLFGIVELGRQAFYDTTLPLTC